MITFRSRNEMVRNADMIARKAHSQYPHISVSRIDTMLGKDKVKHFFWDNMAFKYSLKCASERLKVEMDEKNLYKLTVESLKNGSMYISSLADDGYYYQGNYATHTYIQEVTDEEGIAQAEARYERILLDQKNAKANFKAMQTNIDVAKKDLDRYTKLYEQGAVSKQTLDAAQAKYDSAQANLTQAEESLLSQGGNKVADADLKEAKALRDKAKLNLSYTNIYAPQN